MHEFQSQGHLSAQPNRVQDHVRTGTCQRALLQNHAELKDKAALDVGCGSEILTFFTAHAGARTS